MNNSADELTHGSSPMTPAAISRGDAAVWRWAILVICLIVQTTLYGVGTSSLPLLVPGWITEFGSGSSYVQIIPTLVLLIHGMLGAVVGPLIVRYPLNLIVAAGAALMAATLMTSALFSHSIPQLILFSGIIPGIAMALGGPVVGQSIIALWFPRRSGFPLGIFLAASGLSMMLFPPVISKLLLSWGWRNLYIHLSELCFCVSLLALLTIRRPSVPGSGRCAQSDAALVRRIPMMSLKAGLVHPLLLRISLLFFLYEAVAAGIFYNIALIGRDRGMTLEQSGLALGLLGGVIAIGKISYGRLADSFSLRRILTAALLFMGLSCLTFMLFRTFAVYLVATLFYGMGVSAILPLKAMLVRQHFPARDFPRALGIASAYYSIASLGVLVAAAAHDHSGSFIPFWLLSFVFLGGALMLVFRIKPAPMVIDAV